MLTGNLSIVHISVGQMYRDRRREKKTVHTQSNTVFRLRLFFFGHLL